MNKSFSQVAQQLTVFVALSAAVTACSAASPDEGVGTTAQATSCLPGGSNPAGVRLESCVITPPPPTPQPQPQPPTCTVMDAGACSGTTKTTAGFDPLVEQVAQADGGLVLAYDDSFSEMLSTYNCKPEVQFPQGGSWVFATAICPDVVNALLGDDGYLSERAVVSEVTCNTCTGQPGVGEFVVAWLTNPGVVQTCAACTGIHCGPVSTAPICDSPGSGCGSVGCLKY